MTDKVRIQDIGTNDLLADLPGQLVTRPATVKMWLESAGYFPGTTRVKAATLHAAYADWCRQALNMTGLPIEKWGAEMRKYIRHGRGKAGVFYYISRNPVADVPADLIPEMHRKSPER